MVGMSELHQVNAIDHHAAPCQSVPREVSIEYGEYIAQTACHGCHGPELKGAEGPDISVVAPSDYTIEQFYGAPCGGVGGDGRVLSEQMPWKLLGGLPDTEMRALWVYMRQEPAS
ncbi:MAG: mono/diheme cytochrome c family protein [Kiritimatiellia bacterium]|jgi:mono/diheme cytochrome c family protein